MNGLTSYGQSIRSFQWHFSLHCRLHYSCLAYVLPFHPFHTSCSPTSIPLVRQFAYLAASALTLWESTPRLCLSATSSKDPLLFLSALLWIYVDFCLYYSSDTSLWKHFPCHSVHVYWTHFCTWNCLSGWGFKNTLKFMVSTLSFGFAWMGVISSSCL